MKIKHILEAKLAKHREGWMWAVKRDMEITLRGGRHDKHVTREFFEWIKDNKNTLNHLYKALQADAEAARDFLRDNWGEEPKGEHVAWHWIGELDYAELAVYQQLHKRMPFEELDYVARIMIDVVSDEVKGETL